MKKFINNLSKYYNDSKRYKSIKTTKHQCKKLVANSFSN